jgi:hypothetical protein
MLGRVSGTARAAHWACATASAMAADRILMFLVITEIKQRIAEARITKVTCIARPSLCVIYTYC